VAPGLHARGGKRRRVPLHHRRVRVGHRVGVVVPVAPRGRAGEGRVPARRVAGRAPVVVGVDGRHVRAAFVAVGRDAGRGRGQRVGRVDGAVLRRSRAGGVARALDTAAAPLTYGRAGGRVAQETARLTSAVQRDEVQRVVALLTNVGAEVRPSDDDDLGGGRRSVVVTDVAGRAGRGCDLARRVTGGAGPVVYYSDVTLVVAPGD